MTPTITTQQCVNAGDIFRQHPTPDQARGFSAAAASARQPTAQGIPSELASVNALLPFLLELWLGFGLGLGL